MSVQGETRPVYSSMLARSPFFHTLRSGMCGTWELTMKANAVPCQPPLSQSPFSLPMQLSNCWTDGIRWYESYSRHSHLEKPNAKPQLLQVPTALIDRHRGKRPTTLTITLMQHRSHIESLLAPVKLGPTHPLPVVLQGNKAFVCLAQSGRFQHFGWRSQLSGSICSALRAALPNFLHLLPRLLSGAQHLLAQADDLRRLHILEVRHFQPSYKSSGSDRVGPRRARPAPTCPRATRLSGQKAPRLLDRSACPVAADCSQLQSSN